MIDNQYVIYLAKPLLSKVNIVKNPTLKIWHTYLDYLSYKVIQKLAFVALDITLNGLIPTKICRDCMVDQQQCQSSQESSSWQASEFLKFVHSDLGEPLLAT